MTVLVIAVRTSNPPSKKRTNINPKTETRTKNEEKIYRIKVKKEQRKKVV